MIRRPAAGDGMAGGGAGRVGADGILLRPVRAGELSALSALCLASKAIWGYDAAVLAACREELTLTEEDVARDWVRVADDGRPLAVVHLAVAGEEAMLEKLFVAPGAMGRGLGRRLMAAAADAARDLGARRMIIEADPGAAPFYARIGARAAGRVPSVSIPGRDLPRLVLPLTPPLDRRGGAH